MGDSSDPFLQVQADVLTNLDSARPLFQSYLRIRSTASSAQNPELLEARAELETILQDLSTDLQDLVESVKAVEKDHYKYGLEIEEVQRRRQLVQAVGKEIDDMHSEMRVVVADSQARHGSIVKGNAGNMLPHPSNFENGEEDGEGDDFGQFEQQRQMEIMAEQDETLEGVFQTVETLRAQADTMGRELEEQADMLDDVDQATDRVGGKLKTGMKRIEHVIRQNEGM